VLSVVIVNFNGRRWLPGCLGALRQQRNAPPFETVLVDNASTDDSVAFARTNYPSVRVVAHDRNLGFAGGNNAGARAATGEWLVFLNTDTEADAEWLAALQKAAIEHPECALITSRLVFLHDPAILDSAGDGYLRAGGAFKHGHGAPAAEFTESREVFGACGGAFMIRREAFDALGGFDARFFMVYEDVDLSYRARLRGLRCWYAADAIVRHAGSGSIGVVSPATVYYGQRNLEWAWVKNTPGALLLATALSHAVYSIAGVLHYARAGRLAPALRAKLDAMRGLPAILRARRDVQASRSVAMEELSRWMTRGWLRSKRLEKAFDASRSAAPS
jgi:GT2 family glycosyltransferase